MGKRKMEMIKIENKSARQVCFTKRRGGLFKKASELSVLCGVDVAVLVFSPAGRFFSFAHPNVDSVIDRYIGGCQENVCPSSFTNGDGCGNFWWKNVKVETMDEREQLQQLQKSLEEARGKVVSCIKEMSSFASSSLSSTLSSLIPSAVVACESSDLSSNLFPSSLEDLDLPPSFPLDLLWHHGVMPMESSFDFAKDDELKQIFTKCDELTKPIFTEKEKDEFFMPTASYESIFDTLPPLNDNEDYFFF